MSIKPLINTGIHELNKPLENTPQKTVVIIGCARSGTSMVAGALNKLGIPFGKNAHPPIFEDVNLSSAIEQGQIERQKKIIDKNNEDADIWGFKRPALINHLDECIPNFRNPTLIFIFRDPLAIGKRNAISMESDLLPNMSATMDEYKKIIDYIQQTEFHSILISNEKFLRYPKNNLEWLIERLGINHSNKQLAEALDFIDPEPKDYLDKSRIRKSLGAVKIEKETVSGWARYAYLDDVVTVELHVNQQLKYTAQANAPSESFTHQSMKGKKNIGFEIDIRDLSLSDTDKIEVKVQGDHLNLPLI